MILGIDAGNFRTKVCDGSIYSFPSILGDSKPLPYKPTKWSDFHYVYNKKEGFAGTLADRESYFKWAKQGKSKAHEEMVLRVLLACSLYDEDLQIVVGSPISTHTDKNQIKGMLVGEHHITVNGRERLIRITDCEVGIECASTFILDPFENGIIVDLGSGTLNVAVFRDGQYCHIDSFTFDEGGVREDLDLYKMAEIIRSRVKIRGEIYCIGGMAEDVARVIGGRVMENPAYANAIAFYKIGGQIW